MSDQAAAHRARIAMDRDELARTMQALAEKVDVPTRTRAAAASLAERARASAHRYSRVEYVLSAAAVVLAGIAIGLEIARRRA